MREDSPLSIVELFSLRSFSARFEHVKMPLVHAPFPYVDLTNSFLSKTWGGQPHGWCGQGKSQDLTVRPDLNPCPLSAWSCSRLLFSRRRSGQPHRADWGLPWSKGTDGPAVSSIAFYSA